MLPEKRGLRARAWQLELSCTWSLLSKHLSSRSQINGVYDAIMVGDDTHHCGRPCYKLRGVEAYLYFCRDNFEFLEQSRAGAKGQWRIGRSPRPN